MKILRILLFGISALTSAFAANWTGGSTLPDSTEVIDSQTFYVIQTPEELAWFASEVNAGNTAINGMLANDIVLWEDDFSDETTQWTPIGNEAASAFTGIFNGNGHAISGLYMNDTIENGTVFAGLFGKVGKGGFLENIQVTHASITIHGQTDVDVFAGGIAAYNDSGAIAGCVYEGDIEASVISNNSEQYGYQATALAGGITAYNDSGTIAGCTSRGSFFAYSHCIYQNSNNNAFAGGIVANMKGGSITSALVEGSVYAQVDSSFGYSSFDGSSSAGGVVGFSRDATIEQCVNKASVKARIYTFTGTESMTDIKSFAFAGGIVGRFYGTRQPIINRNTNYGAVSAEAWANKGYGGEGAYYKAIAAAGGIVGELGTGSLSMCANYGRISSKAYAYTYEERSLKTSTTSAFAGGIAGGAFNTQLITHVYNQGNVFDSIISTGNSPAEHNFRFGCAGGLIGEHSSGDTLQNGYSAADTILVSVKDSTGSAGGVIGRNSSKIGISHFYFDSDRISDIEGIGTDLSSEKTANVEGLSTAEMQTDAFAWALNTTGGTATNAGIWTRKDGYPVFGNGTASSIFKVIFDYTSGTITRYADTSGTVVIPEDPESQTGYTLSWYDSEGTFYGHAGDSITVTQDRTLEAQFIPKRYEILFENASVILQKDTLDYATLPEYTGETPTQNATAKYTYTFAGWSPEIVAVSAATTYTALFNSTVNAYEVVFISSGDTLQKDTLNYGSTLVLPDARNNQDSLFTGWYIEGDSLVGIAGESILITSTISLFAGWDADMGVPVVSSGSSPQWSLHGLTLWIQNAVPGTRLAIFDLQGHVLQNTRLQRSQQAISLPGRGCYLVRIGYATHKVKVLVK